MSAQKVMLAACLLVASSLAQAALILQGTFSGNFTSGSAVTLSGSFEATFDDSVLTGIGVEGFDDLQILTSFTMDPNPLGSTIYDTTNVGLDLTWIDGVLSNVFLGGLPNVNVRVANTDDLLIIFLNGVQTSMSYTIVGEQEIFVAEQVSGAISSVPEPATLVLFSLGLAGLGWALRRRNYMS